jgi:hypothetical protein
MVFKLEQIDRAIELAIRRVVIMLGYWPDQEMFEGDEVGFEAAKQAIIDVGKPLIKVYGTGSPDARGELDANNITIDRKAVGFGDKAHAQAFFYQNYIDEDGVAVYRQLKTAEITNDIPYEVRFIANDIALDRIISQIILIAFSNRMYLKGVNEDLSRTVDGFWIMAEGNPVDLSDENYLERMWRYVVKDVIVTPNEVVAARVARIENIEVAVDVSADENSGEQVVIPVE